MNTDEQVEKKYDPRDTTLTFVNREDDLDPLPPEDGDRSLRAEMSCGHAVTPDSLTRWCLCLLEQGQFRFRCPALTQGNLQCKALWSYQEVRRLADLSPEEMQHFEGTMAHLAAAEYCEVQPCPKCKTCVERKDLSNLCVKCTICASDKQQSSQFCWQCLKPWKNPGPRSDRCGNAGCVNKDLELLKTCKTIDLPEVQGATGCPSVRACPTCGIKVEHDRRFCKNILCPRCRVEFCFVCLKLKSECSKTSSPYRLCPNGVAPRQMTVPIWRR
ncbi:E3 ubiquitin-protein ligase RNF19B-like isoform 2-T2 [Polymixia lowei]